MFVIHKEEQKGKGIRELVHSESCNQLRVTYCREYNDLVLIYGIIQELLFEEINS